MKQRVFREPAYWAAVPAPVRHDKTLSATAKLIYAEISALATKRGYCWAENDYFATLYDLSVRTISGLISKLAKKKYVTVQILRDPETNEVIERRIWIVPLPAEEQTPHEENFNTPPEEKCMTPHEKNFQENVYNPGSYIPPKAPQGGPRKEPRKKREPKTTADWMPEEFERFWEFYRTRVRKEDRAGAAQAWDKLKPDDALIARMYRALEKQLASDLWKRGVGIPYAKRYLKNRRWEDVEDQPDTDHASGSASAPRRYIRTDVIDGQEVDVYE